jgi:hypothetical protein
MATIEEVQKRMANRRATYDKARAEQELIDLAAIDALEEARGELLITMTVNTFRTGLPVRVAFRNPAKVEYKRYSDQIFKAQKSNDPAGALKSAHEQLATVCLVYPEPDTELRAQVLEHAAGTIISGGSECAKAVEARRDEEGKG